MFGGVVLFIWWLLGIIRPKNSIPYYVFLFAFLIAGVCFLASFISEKIYSSENKYFRNKLKPYEDMQKNLQINKSNYDNKF